MGPGKKDKLLDYWLLGYLFNIVTLKTVSFKFIGSDVQLSH